MLLNSLRQLMNGIQGKLKFSENGLPSSQQMAFLRQLQKEMKQENVLTIPLEELNVVVFDIETTGFYPEQGDEIISIGAVKVKRGEISKEETFYSLVNYEQELPIEIERMTGITSSHLREADPLSEVLLQFFDFVQNDTLVAHHAKHEKDFMQNASWKCFRTPFKHRLIDTSFLYRIAEPKNSMSRLEELCSHNGIEVLNRHHALGDAILAAKLWCVYVNKMKSFGCQSLRDVYEQLARI